MSQAQTPLPESKSSREGVTARQAAWIGAVATVVAAAVAILAAFITGGMASDSIDRQIASEAEQQRNEFMLNQRQAQYVSFLTEVQAMKAIESSIMGMCDQTTRTIDRTELLKRQRDEFEVAFKTLTVAYSNVRLVSSPETDKAATKVWKFHVDRISALQRVTRIENPPEKHSCKSVIGAVAASTPDFMDDEAAFRIAARKDLGYPE